MSERARATRRCRLGVAILCLAGCSRPAVIAPRIVHNADDAPFLGADSVVISVERAGVPIDGASVRVPDVATSFDLEGVPFGESLGLLVESRLGDVVLARGRSFPFDYPAAGAPPTLTPDVFVGTLGRFARTLETDRAIVAITPTTNGALVATSDGEILAYEAHGASDGSARLVPLAQLPERSGASWIALGPVANGRLLGIGGAAGGASLIDADGHVTATLAEGALDARSGIALAGASDSSWVMAIGGRDAAHVAVADVVRIDITSTLTVSQLPPLDAPRDRASVARVQASDGVDVRDVVLVVGGGVPSTVTLLEVSGGPTESFAVDPPLDSRALVAVETGLVVAAGGSDALGAPSDMVDLFVVRLDTHPRVARFSPAPSLLYAARADAIALGLGPGLALFVGGMDAAGAPVPGAELVEVRLDTLPGRVLPTGALAPGAAAAAAARLADRSVLVGGAGVLSAYIPPRGPS